MMLAWICLGLIAGTPDSDPAAAYKEARAKVGRSPGEQVKLALWCEAHGLTAERLHHLSLAVLADPANAAARGLMGLVSHEGRWRRPEAIAQAVKADPDHVATLAEYEQKRQKAAYTADAQWAMGTWAAEHGLPEQAKAHLTAVIRLDPSRDIAWKKLGYKKHDGRWVTDAQLAAEKAEAEAQKAADRKWKPLLEKYKEMLDRPSKRDEADAALAEVTDSRAVPMIGRVFAASEATQPLAAQLLGQIDSPGSSKALAFVAVFAKSAEARRVAAETLRGRDVREYADLLITLLRDPINYQVRPVGGPGSPGGLFVEGKKADLRRIYAPPGVPFAPGPGDRLGFDESGMPVILRPGGSVAVSSGRITADKLLSALDGQYLPSPDALARLNSPQFGADGPALARAFNTAGQQGLRDNSLARAITNVARTEHSNPSQFGFGLSWVNTTTYEIPIGQMVLQAQKSALSAQQQLDSDVAALDAYNRSIAPRNERARGLLTLVAGKDLGPASKGWKAWWIDQIGYRFNITADQPKPTIVEDVSLDYQPQPVPVQEVVTSVSTGFQRMSCFGAGTPVRTVAGVRPIESLAAGDLVLTQNTSTGALGYKPILVVHHNPPSATFRIKLAGEAIISSHFHRFWLAGRGWVMARDLKPGDPVRTLDGVSPVESVEADKVQLVYNLDVADDADFFAGTVAALVHDNTLPDPRLAPFDAGSKGGAEPARRAD